mmetsp:Transcript_18236/g.33514  ORF Transcript_18236/g.33514 Transcript_18236/m.33514 type:complete len:280 (+) Transcript_18236:519-1358(+)
MTDAPQVLAPPEHHLICRHLHQARLPPTISLMHLLKHSTHVQLIHISCNVPLQSFLQAQKRRIAIKAALALHVPFTLGLITTADLLLHFESLPSLVDKMVLQTLALALPIPLLARQLGYAGLRLARLVLQPLLLLAVALTFSAELQDLMEKLRSSLGLALGLAPCCRELLFGILLLLLGTLSEAIKFVSLGNEAFLQLRVRLSQSSQCIRQRLGVFSLSGNLRVTVTVSTRLAALFQLSKELLIPLLQFLFNSLKLSNSGTEILVLISQLPNSLLRLRM